MWGCAQGGWGLGSVVRSCTRRCVPHYMRVCCLLFRGGGKRMEQRAERAGTPGFRAPEVLLRVKRQTCGAL